MKPTEHDSRVERFMEASLNDRAGLREMLVEVQRELHENTKVTQQIADVVTAFRVIMVVAKWVTAIIAGVAAVATAVNYVRGM